MKRFLLCLYLLINFGEVNGQSIEDYFTKFRPAYSGENAFETVAYIEQFWRLAGNSGFDKSIYHLEEKLKQAGYEEESAAKGRFTYRIERRPLSEPSWEPVDASFFIEGLDEPILEFKTNRNMIAVNSHSTSAKGIEAEIIALENGSVPVGVNVRGKILYAESSPYRVYRIAKESGAAGIITYGNPSYLKPAVNQQSIQFRHIPYDQEYKGWAICLSYEANEKVKKALQRGTLKGKVAIKTLFPKNDELTLVAEIRGSELAHERFVLSAHIQEPGANDNASGAGALIEMARVAAELVSKDELDSRRTITFLWGDEIISTRNFVRDDSVRKKNIRWGMSLDMVGENTAITGGSFLIEKMPDPSAIWTRGDDKHTEWGAGNVKEDDFFPHYFNDLVLEIFNTQGKDSNWAVNSNPFEGGSDHVPFLRSGIPSVLLWHFTDQFYHTDLDRIDKVSKDELFNVGTGALTTVFCLANADLATSDVLLKITLDAGLRRIEKEVELSMQAISQGKAVADENKIVNAWIEWYKEALLSVQDVGGTERERLDILRISRESVDRFETETTKLKNKLNK